MEWDCDFVCEMPRNLHGPGDNSEIQSSHMAPVLMMKVHRPNLEGALSMCGGTDTVRSKILHVGNDGD